VRELKSNPQLHMRAVGFIDDDLAKHDAVIHGVPVLGGRADIPAVIERHKIDQIIIAMPTVPGKEIGKLAKLCEQAGIHPKIMPGLYELIGGKVSVSQLRNVDIEDLLRREPIHTDVTAVRGLLQGKRVLVTGGGGSIGSELCRQILRCEPSMIIVVGHGENSVFDIEAELNQLRDRLNLKGCSVISAIADIRFEQRINDIFCQHRPQVVFHAAAHKHVPLMEANPSEAVTNNVLGTRNLLDASESNGVERFVMISTDKAVRPTSIMGASKRAAELLVHQTAERTGKPYVAVRFGNVLGSRGSVVPTFRKQIAAGGPVTVTHPEMTRFFMTIPEAVQLVLQAAVLGNGGEVFLLDMGEPVKIVDLAKSVIELSGLEVGKDIEIHYTGIRPGEKLYEELFLPDEVYQRTQHEKVFIVVNASAGHPGNLDLAVSDLAYASARNDSQAIREGFQRLIPEYRVPTNANAQAS
jgi:FlaA1/EpsC-like NDP-sugar epimerase